MAIYTGKQSVLDEALGEFKDYGFTLNISDAESLELWFKDKRLAIFHQESVTILIIRESCGNYLRSIGGK